jgi:hypothetical protein
VHQLKPLHPRAIPAALDKAHRYRLLNEPVEAESICLDVLEVEPANQQALIILVLALSDQLGRGVPGLFERARVVAAGLVGEYDREYYNGVLCERWGKAWCRRGTPGSGATAYDWLVRAMAHFERAEALTAPDNDDAVLRWNACARFLERHPQAAPGAEVPWTPQPFLE